ncbi:MAG: Lon-insertion domain-containing protein, partial [Candidatus Micrarchaeia archaeon]
KIPHADRSAVDEILKEAKRWAKEIDSSSGLTLRLRGLSGVIKLAGDFAVADKSQFISRSHVKEALKYSKTVEEQIQETYPNWWKAGMADYAVKGEKKGSDSV